jgi:putative transposase
MSARYRRNSLRYPGYDYSQAGCYFVTVNTYLNRCWFGRIAEGSVRLSEQGEAVERAWLALGERFPGILIDEHIVMPNHIHGIIMLGADPVIPIDGLTVGLLIDSFKNRVLASWREGVRASRWPRYDGSLWHRDYYERIIRNDAELEVIRDYIRGNPAQWSEKLGD